MLDGEPDTKQDNDLCAGGQPFEVICLRPRPDNTAAEARAATALSARRGWRTLIVVTTRDHVLRSRIRFHRCFKGTLGVQGASLAAGTVIQLQALVHEVLGNFNVALFDRGC